MVTMQVTVFPLVEVESQPPRLFVSLVRVSVTVTTVPAGNEAVQVPLTLGAELAQLMGPGELLTETVPQ